MDTGGKPNLFRLTTRKSFGGDKMVMPRRLVKHLAPLQCYKSEPFLRYPPVCVRVCMCEYICVCVVS